MKRKEKKNQNISEDREVVISLLPYCFKCYLFISGNIQIYRKLWCVITNFLVNINIFLHFGRICDIILLIYSFIIKKYPKRCMVHESKQNSKSSQGIKK